MIILLWLTVAFASNSSNIYPEKQFQTDDQHIFNQISHSKHDLKNDLKEMCHLLIQNKDLKNEVKNIYEHLNKELRPENMTLRNLTTIRKLALINAQITAH